MLKKMNKKVIRRTSRNREKELAKKVDGVRHRYSGVMWNRKNDVSNEYFLFEDKFTQKDKYVLTDYILNRLNQNAKVINKVPVLRVGFLVGSRDQLNFIVLRKSDVVLKKDIKPFLENSYSVTLNLNDLKKMYYNIHGNVLCSFRIGDVEYIVMLEDDFVRCYDDIVSGEMI